MAGQLEIIAGPLSLFLAPVGTAFPVITAAPGAPWAGVGTNTTRNYSDDGVSVTHDQKIEQARPAGALGPVAAWRTEEDLTFTVTLWDMTLEQYALALSGVAPTTTAAGVGTPGTRRIGLSRGGTLKTYALLARGVSAYAETMPAQYEVPICYQSGSPKPVFKKGKPAGLELVFTALESAAAASDLERFGRLVMQHQAAL
ncbi:hypothetical protein [Sphingomonas sp. VNH70]|uniref:hypothetical protein n=1 Tax=Sphingomonas silueang TaxID=3156617 RepID=UPI0032B4797A